MAKKHPGICALCGRKFGDLTFEHIPPKASFNSNPARPVKSSDIIAEGRAPWNVDGLPYSNQQQGMGEYSLCKECNNFTGGAYGRAYADIAQVVHAVLSKPIDPSCTGIEIQKVYPQRFIKQVASMFCSVNRIQSMESLRDFVLDKNAVGINREKYMIRMYFTRSGTRRHIPMTGQIKLTTQGTEFVMVSEITGYPFGFILYLNPAEISTFEGIDITNLGDYAYDDTVTARIPLCIKEVNSIFPLDYRSREEMQ